jgi:DNA-binding FrmR family transcriptional regulator
VTLDLSAIRDAQRRLDDADTKLAERLAIIEEQLRALVHVRIRTQLDGPRTLEFGKIGGSWRLMVVYASGDECPLLSCSREERVKALLGGAIERLIRGAVEQIDRMIEERERSHAEALRLISVLDAALVAKRGA